ncbi:hypothetical protein ACE7GA_21340 [Roseomonas sp. CCTCC AB2023176]|uniref:hypothetical protein n=1 Tax=Roseomonas sp. CCTCC AB2023176 TaxID=3342640 RepID=UPI0035D96E05
MSAAAALARAEAAGIAFRLDGGRVRMEAARPPPDDVLADLRRYREDVAHLLTMREALRKPAGFSARYACAREARPDDPEAAAMAAHYAAPPSPAPYTPASADPLRDGLRRAAMLRPPAWADAAAIPSPGARCSCCVGHRWWRETHAPTGWRCTTCHPAPPGMNTVEVST